MYAEEAILIDPVLETVERCVLALPLQTYLPNYIDVS